MSDTNLSTRQIELLTEEEAAAELARLAGGAAVLEVQDQHHRGLCVGAAGAQTG